MEEDKVQEAPETNDVEQAAKRQGWRPEDEFKGSGKWVDAKTYLERADHEIPILRSQLKNLDKKLEERDRTVVEMKDLMFKNVELAYERAKKDLSEKAQVAKKDYDFDTYDTAMKDLKELEKATPVKVEQPQQGVDHEVMEWINSPKNSWFKEDYDLGKKAEDFYGRLEKLNPELTTTEKLKKTERYIMEKHPDKFGEPAKPAYNPVESGVNGTAKKPSRSYDAIPSEIRQFYDSYLKHSPHYGKHDKKSIEEIQNFKQDCIDNYYKVSGKD